MLLYRHIIILLVRELAKKCSFLYLFLNLIFIYIHTKAPLSLYALRFEGFSVLLCRLRVFLLFPPLVRRWFLWGLNPSRHIKELTYIWPHRLVAGVVIDRLCDRP